MISKTYGLSLSSCIRRVAVVCKEKKTPWDLISVDLTTGNQKATLLHHTPGLWTGAIRRASLATISPLAVPRRSVCVWNNPDLTKLPDNYALVYDAIGLERLSIPRMSSVPEIVLTKTQSYRVYGFLHFVQARMCSLRSPPMPFS